MPALKSIRQRPDGMDSAGFGRRKPLLPEIPMMKFSRLFVHHNKAPHCIVMVRNFASFQQSQKSIGLHLQMHRIGDLRGGACA
jgi:hypothetical protein